MSLGYAEKLSYIEDVGEVGMREFFDPPDVLKDKIEKLATTIKESKHLVVFTGAGISTSCGIPDFRGPKGIWTLQREGRPLPQASLPFHRAVPSMTHMALVELERAGILKFVISQNVDGLHLRSGIPREKLAELHGNSFMETCPSCGAEYFRDFEVETIGLKETSRHCSDANCGAKLRDTVLDWEDALPSKEMSCAEKHCRVADVVLCLGTSLQITPACNLPLKCLRGGGEIVIVNLQKTPKDKKASLVIRGFVDKVIAGAMNLLNMQIPPFVRIDYVQIILTKAISADEKYVNWMLRLSSVHGQKAPLPFIKSVEAHHSLTDGCSFNIPDYFLDEEKYKAAVLHEQPFQLKRRTERTKVFEMVLKINLSDGCGCLCSQINIPFYPKVTTDCSTPDKDAVLQKLRDTAIQGLCCGQNAIIEKKIKSAPNGETSTFAIVTNIIMHNKASKAFEIEAISNRDNIKRRKRSPRSNGSSRKRSKTKGSN